MLDNLTLTDEQLEIIVKCKSLEDLHKEFSEDDYQRIIEEMAQADVRIKKSNKKVDALIHAINISIIPIDTWWFLLGTIGAGVIGAAGFPLTLIFIGIGLSIGAHSFYTSFKKNKTTKKNLIECLQFFALKNDIVDKLIAHKTKQIADLEKEHGWAGLIDSSVKQYIPSAKQDTRKNRIETPSQTKAIIAGLSTTACISFTYVIGITAIFNLLGYITIASAFTGPIGLPLTCIALLTALGIGAYLAYKHYQTQRNEYINNCDLHDKEIDLVKKEHKYADLTMNYKILNMRTMKHADDNEFKHTAKPKPKLKSQVTAKYKGPNKKRYAFPNNLLFKNNSNKRKVCEEKHSLAFNPSTQLNSQAEYSVSSGKSHEENRPLLGSSSSLSVKRN